MKAKVLTYAKDGNTIINKYLDLNSVNGSDSIYATAPDEYGRIGLIFRFNDIYYCEGEYPEQVIKNNAERLPEIKANYLSGLSSANWIRNIYIRLYELLEMDTTILEKRRAEIIAEREAKEQDKKQEQQMKYAESEAKRKAELTEAHTKLKAGERIERDAFLELCKLNGIELHSRTVGMLNRLSVCEIGTQNAFIPKGRINLDKVFEAARQLAAN